MMTSFLSFHAAAAARGEDLHPELLALYVGVPVVPHPELTLTSKGTIQSRSDLPSTDLVGHANVSPFPQASTRRAR